MQVELQNLSKDLGGSRVLDELNVVFEGGQTIALLGANGAGKTTLLNLVAGLYQPSAGAVLVDGEALQRSNLEQRRKLHLLPDIPLMFPGQTPLEYIAFAVEAYQRRGRNFDELIVDLLEEFDLLAVADCPSRTLSRGQKYKATLIAMLAINPEIWILDEPFTSGMDPLGLSAMRQHLERARSNGSLVLYSTQLVEVAAQMSTKVCVLADNRIAAFDSSHALQESADHSPQLNALLQQLREQASNDDLPT